MADLMFVGEHTPSRVRISAAPAMNALCSLCLLSQESLDNISHWVDTTRQHLTDEERVQAMDACHASMTVSLYDNVSRSESVDIEQWLDDLAELDPEWIRSNGALRLRAKARRILGPSEVPELSAIETDRTVFLDLIQRIFAAKGMAEEFDADEEGKVFDDRMDGERYRDRLVAGIRHLWEKYLRAEWPRVATTIDKSVAAFNSIDLPGDSVVGQLKFITERDAIPEEWVPLLEAAREVVFVPSVHIGPFMTIFDDDGSRLYVVGRARIPAGSSVQAAELDRSDLLIRLDALSDETRLRVLELASVRGTITTQEVMEALDLSQSSASRHLTQLTATGLLLADASERTKRYRLNGDRIDQVFSGLKNLLGAGTRV